MPDVKTLTDAEPEQLRRAVLDEQEARVLAAREEAVKAAEAQSVTVTLENVLDRFLDSGGSVELIRVLSERLANRRNNK